MSSAAQVAANIANAQHSTGPRTEEGKAAASRNSLKHGLTAQTVVLPGEDEAAYLNMCAAIFKVWAPANETETQLLRNLCDTQWRINRCARLEASILSVSVDVETIDFKALDNLSKHESRLKRIYSATLKEVRDLISARIANRDIQVKQAMMIRRADKLQGRTTDLKEFGFDFSLPEVAQAINREDALLQAYQIIAQSVGGRN